MPATRYHSTFIAVTLSCCIVDRTRNMWLILTRVLLQRSTR